MFRNRLSIIERIKCIEQCFKVQLCSVHIEVPDLDLERKLKLENFDDYFNRLNLPYKLRRYPQESRAFVRLRLEEFENGYKLIEVSDYEELYRNVEDEEKKLAIIENINMIALYYNRIVGRSVFSPRTISLKDMEKMLFDYKDYASRVRYIHYMFVREFDVWRHDIESQEDRAKRRAAELKELEDFEQIGCFDSSGSIQYGYWRNTMFGRYYDKARMHYSLNKLRQAEMFGQKFVVDCSFDESMADYETISVARQISSIHNANRYSSNPFKLYFTGYNPKNRGFLHATKQLSAIIHSPEYFFNFHSESYQDLLKGERLIYLSPDARHVMREYDHEAVYIIGALVSKTHKSTMTLDKAREEGIECLRLPIHEHVTLKPGVKRVLSFQGVFKILLHFKEHGDWEAALRAGIQPHKLVD